MLITIFADTDDFFETAKTIFDGCLLVDGCEPVLKRVQLAETPEAIIFETGGMKELEKEEYLDLEVASGDDFGAYDGYIFGFPSVLGLPSVPFFQHIEKAGPEWSSNQSESGSSMFKMIGKPAAVFSSSQYQHGGLETSLISLLTALFHLGCVICGCPYNIKSHFESETIVGISPYGVSSIRDSTLKKPRSESQTQGLIEFGKHIGTMTQKLLNKQEKNEEEI